MQYLAVTLCLSLLASTAIAEGSNYGGHPPLVQLKIQEPKTNARGLSLESDWNLGFRISTADWVGYLDTRREFTSGTFQALILDDPDGCLDLSHVAPGSEPFESGCAGPDETFLKFQTDRFDGIDNASRLNRSTQVEQPAFLCPDVAADALIDDELTDIQATGSFDSANRLYLNGNSGATAVGAYTGGATRDCYGYGADDDLPGLVVMIDAGSARFYDLDFNPLPDPASGANRRIRNSAGLLSNVGVEFSDKQGTTSIVAHMRAERGMFEPIAIYDADIANPLYNVARRVDGGPIEFFNLAADPTVISDMYNELKTLLPASYEVIVRAVLVDGTAPHIVEDMDGNGKFNAKDVELMGYTLRSNQAKKRLRLVQREQLDDSSDLDCVPELVLVEGDLDGESPNNLGPCRSVLGDGTSRSVRRGFL